MIIFDENRERVLMVHNRKGESSYWSIPGGEVEPGETLAQAAVREAKEETGMDIEVGDLYSVREVYFTGRKHHAIIFTFLATSQSGHILPSDPDDEIADVQWMDIDNANELMPFLTGKMRIDNKRDQSAPYYYHGVV